MSELKRSHLHRPKRGRGKLRVTSVLGETLILAGIAVIGYIAWQPWHTGIQVQNEQESLSATLRQTWVADEETAEKPVFDGDVALVGEKSPNESFAVLYVPAFGKSYSNVIAEGVSPEGVLNLSDKGIGRYSSTQQFGEVGNVGLAAHRSGAFIAPFKNITDLRVGDPLFVETSDGWYVYRYRSTEYVAPNEVDVLDPFPRMEIVEGDERFLTLTSCHPKNWGIDERVISYSVLEEFIPKAEGPPQELVELNPRFQKDAKA